MSTTNTLGNNMLSYFNQRDITLEFVEHSGPVCRAFDWGLNGRWFEPHRQRRTVSLSKTPAA